MDVPRVCVFNEEYMTRIIQAELTGSRRGAMIEYGNHKVQESSEVCYTRGWDLAFLKAWEHDGGDFVKTKDELHRVLQNPKNNEPTVVDAISKIGADCAMSIKISFNALYPEY